LIDLARISDHDLAAQLQRKIDSELRLPDSRGPDDYRNADQQLLLNSFFGSGVLVPATRREGEWDVRVGT
jgi:hypothetical protein